MSRTNDRLSISHSDVSLSCHHTATRASLTIFKRAACPSGRATRHLRSPSTIGAYVPTPR